MYPFSIIWAWASVVVFNHMTRYVFEKRTGKSRYNDGVWRDVHDAHKVKPFIYLAGEEVWLNMCLEFV